MFCAVSSFLLYGPGPLLHFLQSRDLIAPFLGRGYKYNAKTLNPRSEPVLPVLLVLLVLSEAKEAKSKEASQ